MSDCLLVARCKLQACLAVVDTLGDVCRQRGGP